MMAGSNWSREELDALLRAWRDALDAAPHTKSFRLLEFIMQRFAVRFGKDPLRSAGSVEIKRKYMKNMVRVISQFDERSGSKKTWFALPPRERKQWFLFFNAKSYKFANMSEECYRTVKELMEIEEVVLYGNAAAAGSATRGFDDDEDAEEEGDDSDDASDASGHKYVCDVRVSLMRRKDGSWKTRPAESSGHYSVPHGAAPGKNDASRHHSVFDQLVSAASGARDVAMIDAAPDGEDGDESVTSTFGNDHEYGDDGELDSDLLGDLTPFKLPRHQDNRIEHRSASPRASLGDRHRVSANSEREVSIASRAHSRSPVEVLHERYVNQRTGADLEQVVSDLERQAQQAKELLDQLRDERNQGDRGQHNGEREDGDVKRILDRIEAREDELRAVCEQQKAEYEEQKNILSQLKVAREAQKQDNEAKKRDQDERRQLLKLIRLDREDRERFRQERQRELQEQSRFLKSIQEDQEQRRQDANERRAFLKQLKRYREALPLKSDNERMQESMVEERLNEPDQQDEGYDALVHGDQTRSKQSDAADKGPRKSNGDAEVVEQTPETASDEPEAAKEGPQATTDDEPVAAEGSSEVQMNPASAEKPKELKEAKEPEEIKTRRATRQSILRDQTVSAPMASRTRSKQAKNTAR